MSTTLTMGGTAPRLEDYVHYQIGVNPTGLPDLPGAERFIGTALLACGYRGFDLPLGTTLRYSKDVERVDCPYCLNGVAWNAQVQP